MSTDFLPIPEQLMLNVKEAAQREHISLEELVLEALEQRLNDKGFRRFLKLVIET